MGPSDPSSTPDGSSSASRSQDSGEPDPSDFLASELPRRPVNTVLVVASAVVLVLIVGLGVLTWLTIRDEPTSNGLPTQTSSGDQQQIVNVVTDFIDYANAGQTSKANELACAGLGLMENPKDTAPATNPAVIDKITGISVQGDRATAIVTVSTPSTPEVNAQTMTMHFLNKGGWKVCKA